MLLGDPYFSDLGQFYDILAAIQKRQERTQSTKREKKVNFYLFYVVLHFWLHFKCLNFFLSFDVLKFLIMRNNRGV